MIGLRFEERSNAYPEKARMVWQASFHPRIRSYEDYNEKLNYMKENPVKAGLVESIEDWPYRGEMFSALPLVALNSHPETTR